ncbi:nucleoside ABC transporter membrane protein [Paenibacillus tianmuensis]|uniref:Nucleoside ABC transporter membrane protein n=1 Tax=Paenibacillus tianmuensis TaxID=624147 RepID=A0A1G4T600_9BACL|nr:ABC transporter permease [Paenibacillus tianmuensis]SCW76864.1 nucleoside ABC transporter membrane protein [Paenibacillus tianmuensis]
MDLMNNASIIIHNAVVYSTPLILTALGGVYSERSGVVNIGLEGLMVIGAFSGTVTTLLTGSPLLGIVAAVLAGTLFSLLHAVASVTYHANQVVSGVAINFLAIGLSIFLTKQMFDGAAQTSTIKNLIQKWEVPGLSQIPYLGKMFFIAYPTSYLAIGIVLLSWYVMYKTPFGLRLRAVGEHPAAADTLGIRVSVMRYLGVMISGGLAGLGGAVISLTTTSNFSYSTISGQGFIALAAVIFGKWHPVGAMLAALFFGLAQAINSSAQVLGYSNYVPTAFIQMLPYVLTLIVLAGFVGRAEGPKAVGNPYIKGSR